jgi:ankyrin repeat protein
MQRLLLTKKMYLNDKDAEGKTVLHLAAIAMCNVSTIKDTEAENLIQELVEYGSDINATDKKGQSALHICCYSSHYSKYI